MRKKKVVVERYMTFTKENNKNFLAFKKSTEKSKNEEKRKRRKERKKELLTRAYDH